jgi:hypothetical protein
MSVRLLDTRPAGLDDAFDEYRQRCMLLFMRAFRSRDKPGFLHEAPLVRVARYLLIDPLAIPPEFREEAVKIAQEKGW